MPELRSLVLPATPYNLLAVDTIPDLADQVLTAIPAISPRFRTGSYTLYNSSCRRHNIGTPLSSSANYPYNSSCSRYNTGTPWFSTANYPTIPLAVDTIPELPGPVLPVTPTIPLPVDTIPEVPAQYCQLPLQFFLQ